MQLETSPPQDPQTQEWHTALEGGGHVPGWGVQQGLPTINHICLIPQPGEAQRLPDVGRPWGQSSFSSRPVIILGCVYLTFCFGWARKISLAPFDQNIAAHTSCEDTHTEEAPPTPSEKTHLARCWQGPALGPRGRLLGAARGRPGLPHRLSPGGISVPHQAQGPQGEGRWHRCGWWKPTARPGPLPPELQEADRRMTGEDSP